MPSSRHEKKLLQPIRYTVALVPGTDLPLPMTDLSNTCLEGLPNADSAPPVLLRVMLLAGCSCPELGTRKIAKIANEGGCCDYYINDVYTGLIVDCPSCAQSQPECATILRVKKIAPE